MSINKVTELYTLEQVLCLNKSIYYLHSFKRDKNSLQTQCSQRPKKVVSDSPGLVDFAIGLVNSVFNLPDGQVMFYEEFE